MGKKMILFVLSKHISKCVHLVRQFKPKYENAHEKFTRLTKAFSKEDKKPFTQ